ncbi:MAG: prepilin-type N-terminal cleavage/methylation domain-containing protein [Acidobacteriota bacterium]|jgi:prepilin-type N-terminal cleavage/methylation domain-containing protein
MPSSAINPIPKQPEQTSGTNGFTLVEFLIASTLLLIISIPLFSALNEIEQSARQQAEIGEILDNLRIALQEITRRIRQAGNDPHGTGFEAVSIIGPAEIRIRSDLTGSMGPGKPNKGDPDGDTNDSREDQIIRYNNSKKRIETVSAKGSVQIVADKIAGLSFEYLDDGGQQTADGSRVRSIRVKIYGEEEGRAFKKGRRFGIQLTGHVRIFPKK